MFAIIDPKKILDKIKLHLLAHIQEDIICFSPLVGVATEIFECLNAVFRMCSINSNHHAPSWDIAWQLADQEGMRQCLTGGYWQSGDDESWE
jgi:sterol desaturase/sphingolipid hydroxylase (fatty acid hydroxylase superfamily)